MFVFRRNCSRPGQLPRHRLTSLFFATLLALMFSQLALASKITIASPVNGTHVSSSIWVRAHNVGCEGLRPIAFGYSIDNSRTIAWGVTAYDIDATKVPVGAGTHAIHFKSWTSKGRCPVANTTFSTTPPRVSSPPPPVVTPPLPPVVTPPLPPVVTPPLPPVVTPPAPGLGLIPSDAIWSANLDGATRWAGEQDAAMPGSARGSTVYPATTPLGDDAREFYMTYSSRGGVRWHVSFAKDDSATHFVYDTFVYLTDPSQVANIELDMNQVISDGRTVIFGTQCSTYSKTWEYTIVSGGTHWKPSNIACNPQNWAANTWHHIQIASHRNDGGMVTYDWVTFDETHSDFNNATGNSAEELGWAKGTLLLNFQLDGAVKGSGAITAYVHKMTVLRW
jgi:hypothetical protein